MITTIDYGVNPLTLILSHEGRGNGEKDWIPTFSGRTD
jgi:hypothetical protein